jgi:hypothetical protein
MKKSDKLLRKSFVKKNANIECLVGEYIVIGNPHLKSLELKRENIVRVKRENGHAMGCCSGDDKALYGIELFSNDIRLRYLPFFPRNEPIYTFVLHSNGVIRFRINKNIPCLYQFSFTYIDSTGFIDTIDNLLHMKRNGCFCFGILTQDNDIVRYNRWNDDCELFAKYVKVHD